MGEAPGHTWISVHESLSCNSLPLRARGASAAAWKVLRTAEAVKVVDKVNMQLAIGAHSSSSTLLELAPAAPSVPETVTSRFFSAISARSFAS